MPQYPAIGDTLRKAIEDSGLSINALSKLSKIPQPTLHKFFVDRRDLRISNADKLAAIFNLSLQPIKQSPSKGKK